MVKMKKIVLVTFSSSNQYEAAEKDSVVFQTAGTFYDKDGKIIKIESYYDNAITGTENYIYDNGALIEKNYKSADGT